MTRRTALSPEQAATIAAGRATATALVDEWQEARADLRVLLEADHPPITDRFGRVWVWRDGDLYAHDDTLAFPRTFIDDPRLGLPRPGLAADNPNYAGLCSICRRGGAS